MYDGIIQFIEELKRCEAVDAHMAAVLLVFVGIDTMAFLSLPAGQNAQSKRHFIAWADKYMKAHSDQMYKYTGIDLYAARCSALHCFTAEGSFHRQFPRSMRYVFSDGGRHYASLDSRLVVIGSLSLINHFVLAVDAFLTDIQNDAALRERVEARLPKLYARRPFPPAERTSAQQI
jgi:hypothetical protein